MSWPAQLAWNWGGGAGRVDAHVIGLQFGAKWTEGSGFTENGGTELTFDGLQGFAEEARQDW